MPRRQINITGAELRILKILWERREASVGEIKKELEAEGDRPAYTTVMTLMKQLADKGALAVDKSRQPFIYRPLVQRERVLQDRIRQFLGTVFNNQAGELVLRLVEEADLSPEDLRRIASLIESREQNSAKPGQPRGKEDAKP